MSAQAVKTCETDLGLAMACEQHIHCCNCFALLDPVLPPDTEKGFLICVCSDCPLPFFPVDDPMAAEDRVAFEWEMRQWR